MSALDDRVAALAPVPLDELVAEAALLTRVDRKYVLPLADAERVVAALPAGTRVLEIGGHRGLRYETVYFDTPDLLSWRLAAHSRRRRFKVRTRTYADTGVAFLEVKTRGARRATVKERIDYDVDDRERLTPEGHEYAEASLRPLGLDAGIVDELVPTLVSGYRRTTFAPPEAGLRATLDVGLAWELPDGTRLETPQVAIVETKSGARASDVDRVLWRAGHRPVSISKYGTGLAAIRGDLAAGRWARVLRRHFAREGGVRCAA
ncbi:MAG: molecular chaperone [Micrococcales bacterium 73-13]|nr:MAG: molecular chaperone [Micrococcales bacterium 73-13]